MRRTDKTFFTRLLDDGGISIGEVLIVVAAAALIWFVLRDRGIGR